MAEYIEREAVIATIAKHMASVNEHCYSVNHSKEQYDIYAMATNHAIDYVRCVPTADVAPVVHGKWVVNRKSEDDYKHHMCNKCKTDAPFHYTYTDDYDEGFDGEWFYLGQREDDIVEHMGNFCPNCGADMRERKGDDA